MDEQTSKAYLKGAQDYSDEWNEQLQPSDIYGLIEKHFVSGGKTADGACGNGRDAGWVRGKGFDNVFCETVIMHLPHRDIAASVESLVRIVRKGGLLYLSWRVTEGEDARHADGRLYTAFDNSLVLSRFSPESVLHFEDVVSKSSGKRVCRLIARLV